MNNLSTTEQDSVQSLKLAIKAKVQEKQLCSKAFKATDKTSDEFSTLKKRMSATSKELKILEAKLKSILNKDKTLQPDQLENHSRFSPSLLQFPSEIADVIDLKDKSQWNLYIEKHPQSSPYHLYQWQTVITDSFSHPATYLAARDKNKNIIGVLPIIWQKSAIFGKNAASIPYFNYGQPLVDNKNVLQHLTEKAEQLIKEKQFSQLEIRTTLKDINLPQITHKISMLLTLPQTSEQLWQDIGSKVRAQIKQGEKHHFKYKEGKAELIHDFYSVYSRNMRDLGTPVYDIVFFKNIFNNLPDICSISVLYRKGKPVATAFLIAHKDVLEIPWASTLRSTNKMNTNMVLYWNILKSACDKGYNTFDFGRSSPDSGTYKFKKQWGAKPIKHYWYYIFNDSTKLPELNPNNPKFKLLIAIWKRLPLFIANLLGPIIAKDLP